MIKALLLILAPAATWERIARARRNVLFVLFLYLAPTMALSFLAEMAGHNYLVRYFTDQGAKLYSQDAAIRYGAIQFAAGVIVAFFVARLIKLLSETFHNRNTYAQCFAVTAYALGPFYLMHILDALPILSPWITFAVGVVFAFGAIYHAIPLVLKPDPPHAFGLFLMSGIFLAMVSLLGRMATLQFLPGKIHFH